MASYTAVELKAIESMVRAYTANMAIENLNYQAEQLEKAAVSYRAARAGQPIKVWLSERVQRAQRSFEIAADVARRFNIDEQRITATFPTYSISAS